MFARVPNTSTICADGHRVRILGVVVFQPVWRQNLANRVVCSDAQLHGMIDAYLETGLFEIQGELGEEMSFHDLETKPGGSGPIVTRRPILYQ